MALPTNLNLENFIGPCFLVIWLSFILYGLLLAQAYFYFTTYRDSIGTRLTVALICILETLDVIFCVHMIYTYLIVDFANLYKMAQILWSVGAAVYTELVISGSVQLYYVWRIWRWRNVPISICLIVVLCARISVGARAIASLYIEHTWLDLIASTTYRRLGLATFAIGVLMDLSIPATFMFFLARNHMSARARKTKNILQRLMDYVLGGGILTAMTSITILILFAVFKQIHFAGVLMLLSKVYANSLLSMLNIRQDIERAALSDNNFSLQLSKAPGEMLTSRNATQIHIIRETQTVTASDTCSYGVGKEAVIEDSEFVHHRSQMRSGFSDNVRRCNTTFLHIIGFIPQE